MTARIQSPSGANFAPVNKVQTQFSSQARSMSPVTQRRHWKWQSLQPSTQEVMAYAPQPLLSGVPAVACPSTLQGQNAAARADAAPGVRSTAASSGACATGTVMPSEVPLWALPGHLDSDARTIEERSRTTAADLPGNVLRDASARLQGRAGGEAKAE